MLASAVIEFGSDVLVEDGEIVLCSLTLLVYRRVIESLRVIGCEHQKQIGLLTRPAYHPVCGVSLCRLIDRVAQTG